MSRYLITLLFPGSTKSRCDTAPDINGTRKEIYRDYGFVRYFCLNNTTFSDWSSYKQIYCPCGSVSWEEFLQDLGSCGNFTTEFNGEETTTSEQATTIEQTTTIEQATTIEQTTTNVQTTTIEKTSEVQITSVEQTTLYAVKTSEKQTTSTESSTELPTTTTEQVSTTTVSGPQTNFTANTGEEFLKLGMKKFI